MSFNIGAATETNVITLATSEILDFSVCQEFWHAAQQARDRDVIFIIDMGQTERIRDSGYALLLMLKECTGKDQSDINIVNCRPELQRDLQARDFDRYFTFM